MAKAKVNKSQKIRDYKAKHPNADAKSIAAALKVSQPLVYQVLGAKKSKTPKAKKKRTGGSNGSVDQILAGAKLVQLCDGDIDLAVDVIKALGIAREGR